jgi:hypothetical protein
LAPAWSGAGAKTTLSFWLLFRLALRRSLVLLRSGLMLLWRSLMLLRGCLALLLLWSRLPLLGR